MTQTEQIKVRIADVGQGADAAWAQAIALADRSHDVFTGVSIVRRNGDYIATIAIIVR